MRDISLCFVHFRGGLNLEHLDAAWYSLSRQEFTNVNCVVFLDNNTEHSPEAIQDILFRYYLPVPLILCFDKHGDPSRTHSWSVNRVCQLAPGPWVMFSRTDYILDFNALTLFNREARDRVARDHLPFVTGYCLQLGYDAQLSNVDAMVDIEQYDWRNLGMDGLRKHPYFVEFVNTDKDAGVWLTKKEYLAAAGWMNEKMVSWGYQQSTFQRALKNNRVRSIALPQFLFAHQHHYSERDFKKAEEEYFSYGNKV